jgi:F-type H+-transporting ATPase subunit epsilon
MRLEVITPMAVCVDRPVRRIVAEAPDGHFGMLPGHVDFVTELVPGILLYETEEGTERFVAVNSGTLVKCGDEVRVAVRGAVEGDDLSELRAGSRPISASATRTSATPARRWRASRPA